MTKDSLKKKLKEEGLIRSGLYYLGRFFSKAELAVVGKWFGKHGRLRPDCIVLKNRTMQDMTDNPRAFYEYLLQKKINEKYQIIWMVSDKKKCRRQKEKNVKFVTAENKYGWSSPLAYYYGAVAGFFFYTNNTAYLNFYHCEGQTTVNMWHGCGYKDVARDNKPPAGKSMMHFDHALVPGDVFVKTKSKYWNCSQEKILPLGYPRYDWMLHSGMDRAAMLKKLFGREDARTIIWMPTFRKSDILLSAENQIDLPFQLPALKNERELEELDHCLKEKEVFLIIKKHPLQSGWDSSEENYTNIRYVTEEMLAGAGIWLYEMVGVCDALISDYSSIAVDFMLLDRPLGYVLTDLECYRETRGFVFENPEEYMPGAKLYDLADLENFVCDISEGKDPFKEERRKLLPAMHTMPVKDSYCGALARYLNIQ